MIYLRLFWEFFKTGLFSVGGGMATLPFLKSMSASTGWFTLTELADMVAVSESTPGPIGVNMATYVGYNTAGIAGAVVATLGVSLPSVLVTLIIAMFLKAFRENRIVDKAFAGIRPASTGLIGAAALSLIILCMFADGSVQPRFLALFAAVWLLSNFAEPLKRIHPIFFILFGAVAGALFRFAH
ncbi:MAG TPA: chromate transporter [Bacillota bacterium]|nr:chromate transporter [Bacillota bacterium]